MTNTSYVRFLLFTFVHLSFIISAGSQTQVTIGASKDNTMIEDTAGSLSNGLGPSFFVGRVGTSGQGTIRRGLIAFDVGTAIPAGATIQGVTLILNMSQTSSGAQTISLHRALSPWGEGSSNSGGGGGAPATPGDATWLHTYFDTLFWANAGGDYSVTLSASQTVSGIGVYRWGSTAELVNDVQRWLDSSGTNFGWVLVGNESMLQTVKRFDSKDDPNPSVRPQLQILFDPPVATGEQSDIDASLALFQNYPNPFNSSTTLSYKVPDITFVTMSVYNLLGQEVARLVNEVRQGGRHEVGWDAEGLPSGVYLYRLLSGQQSLTRTMIHLK